MDEAVKERFKWKFFGLAALLNLILLLLAGAVIAYLLVPPIFGTAIAILLIAIAVVFIIAFIRMYRKTQVWLDEHGGEKHT